MTPQNILCQAQKNTVSNERNIIDFRKSLFRVPKEPLLGGERAYIGIPKSLFRNPKEPLLIFHFKGFKDIKVFKDVNDTNSTLLAVHYSLPPRWLYAVVASVFRNLDGIVS